jgi:thioesterase domain-containing protein
MDALYRLQSILHAEIPILREIGIVTGTYDNRCLVVHAPLAQNTNHTNTAFAGSLNAVATVAGWGTLWLLLDGLSLHGRIMIQDSAIEYLHPVTSDLVAHCCLPAPDELDRFLAILRKKARARLQLEVAVFEEDRIAVRFTGRYVVHLSTSAAPNQNSNSHKG